MLTFNMLGFQTAAFLANFEVPGVTFVVGDSARGVPSGEAFQVRWYTQWFSGAATDVTMNQAQIFTFAKLL